MIKTQLATTSQNCIELSLSRSTKTEKGSDAVAEIDPSATRRNHIVTARKTKMATTMDFGVSKSSDPKPVATPFPPLNLSHTGATWPAIAAKAAAKRRVRCPGKSADGTMTAAKPFEQSKTKVARPSHGAVRATFVAPMLPLPVVR